MANPPEIPYKHCIYDGVPIPDFIHPERFEEIKQFHKCRSDDVFIATYQKSGTTWLQHIVNQLLDSPQGDLENINLSVPWLEEETQPIINAMKSPRIFKTHDKWSWIPKGDDVKYIYCYRNPKDVCCSYYNHMANVFKGHYDYHATFDEFYRDVFIKQGISEQGWYFDHLRDWLDQMGNPNILFIAFEDMVEDLSREILKLVDFLSVECSEEKLEGIFYSSLFDAMSKNDAVNYSWRNGTVKCPNSKFLNSGKVGSWKKKLSQAQSEEISKLTSELIEIPYGIRMRYTL